MRGAVVDIVVPGLIGAVVLVIVDVIRGKSAPWWVVLVIFLAVFAIYEGFRYLRRRSR